MRRAVLILMIASACASGTPSQNRLRIDVIEQRSQRMAAVGPHAYTVRITNMSAGPIEVESIELAPAGLTDLTFEDAMQNVGEVVSPGETRDFQMFVSIESRGRSSAQFVSSVDSVSVTIPCRSDSGDFVASEVVSISRR